MFFFLQMSYKDGDEEQANAFLPSGGRLQRKNKPLLHSIITGSATLSSVSFSPKATSASSDGAS